MELENMKAPIDSAVRTDGATALMSDGAAKTAPDLRGQIAPNLNPLYLFTKRLFDIIVSGLALILLSPIMLLTALAIKIEDPKGTVFYNAPRGGKDGVPFPCRNLRWMEFVRFLHEIIRHIRANFCAIQTIIFYSSHFRHKNGVFPAVEAG